jgi:hypothetical protein
MAPHLARSYHHLFPLDPYKEISNEKPSEENSSKKVPIYRFEVDLNFILLLLSINYFNCKVTAMAVNIRWLAKKLSSNARYVKMSSALSVTFSFMRPCIRVRVAQRF